MIRFWSFGQKLGAGFALVVTLAVVIGAISVSTLRSVVETKDRVLTVHARNLLDADALRRERGEVAAATRGFLMTGESSYHDEVLASRQEFLRVMDKLRKNAQGDELRALLDDAARAHAEHRTVVDRAIEQRRAGAPMDAVVRDFEAQTKPTRAALISALSGFAERTERELETSRTAANQTAATATNLIGGVALAAILLAAAVAYGLSRTLSRQIGTATAQMQSSSAELQSAANQQVSGAKEHSTSMREITTTISELLATSRQIAESAQRVAQIAGETNKAATDGQTTLARAQESIATIRRQVDQIVGHMLDLGKKSQQIGAVLELVSELAEQTNILSVNASIEAAGAGEAGKRFGVVAEEIRKLADRVAASTKEIRALIEDVRSAVNTTVMATETGSKAVDGGSRQFGEVTSAFQNIAGLVGSTTEAAREIELSTKQQATAVEQVNVAVANVAQATRESEASAGQTLQTASELAVLSNDLSRMVQPRAAA